MSVIPTGRIGNAFVNSFTIVTLLLFLCSVGMLLYLIIRQNSYTSQLAAQVRSAQTSADHRWCTTVELLTSHPIAPPADPAQNPSRVASYKLYLDFLSLKKAFGCS